MSATSSNGERRPRSARLDHLTWPEIKAAAEGDTAVIVPVGSTEQHGYHLPLNTDVVLPESLAIEAGAELGSLVAPPIAYGYRPRPLSGGGRLPRHDQPQRSDVDVPRRRRPRRTGREPLSPARAAQLALREQQLHLRGRLACPPALRPARSAGHGDRSGVLRTLGPSDGEAVRPRVPRLDVEHPAVLETSTVEPEKAVAFNDAFRPPSWSRGRWQSMRIACRRGQSLPPISVYRLDGQHFVIDGHHRVSVAKSLEVVSVDADVIDSPRWGCGLSVQRFGRSTDGARRCE